MKEPLYNGKGAIFDLDGTLLDTLDDLAASGNYVLEKFGFDPVPAEGFRYYVGNGFRNMIRRALGASLQNSPRDIDVHDDLIFDMVRAVSEHYKSNWHNETRLYVGIDKLLAKLQARRIPFSVCSNKEDAFVKQMVHHYFPGVYFVGAIGQRSDVPLKPDSTGPMMLADRMRLRPQDIVFIGDTKVDMQTAVGAEMLPIGVNWGFRPKEELLEYGARLVIDEPEELLRCFC